MSDSQTAPIDAFLAKHNSPGQVSRQILSIETDASLYLSPELLADRHQADYFLTKDFVGKPDQIERKILETLKIRDLVLLMTEIETFDTALYEDLMLWKDTGVFHLINEAIVESTDKTSRIALIFRGRGSSRQNAIISKISDYHLFI